MPVSKTLSHGSTTLGDGADVTERHIPIVEESLQLGKRVVETGRVSVRTVVDHEEVLLRDTLTHDIVAVDRVAIGREVTAAPAPREEGDLLIIPIVEERLIVEKRLFLVEELHVRRSTVSSPVEVPATRRVMRAEIDRTDPSTTHPENN